LHSNTIVIVVKSNARVMGCGKAWKSFCAAGGEFQGAARVRAAEMMRAKDSIKLRACSACAGDYEDPDRTAGEEFEEMLARGEASDSDSGNDDSE